MGGLVGQGLSVVAACSAGWAPAFLSSRLVWQGGREHGMIVGRVCVRRGHRRWVSKAETGSVLLSRVRLVAMGAWAGVNHESTLRDGVGTFRVWSSRLLGTRDAGTISMTHSDGKRR